MTVVDDAPGRDVHRWTEAAVHAWIRGYKSEDFLARVQQLTPDGVDIVLDPIGGAVSLRSFRALRPGGRLVVYGRHATIANGKKNWPAVFDWFRADFHKLLQLLRQGTIRPTVAQRLPLTEARHAHEIIESTAATGKLVLLPQA